MMSAVGNLAIFQGASEAVISAAILPERATRKNGQIATALRVALNRVREKAPLILFPYQIRGKIGRGCVGFAVTARRGDAPANPPCPRPILNATDAMRINQWFLKGGGPGAVPLIDKGLVLFPRTNRIGKRHACTKRTGNRHELEGWEVSPSHHPFPYRTPHARSVIRGQL